MESFTSRLAHKIPWSRTLLSLLIVGCLVAVISTDEDYYKLLGVSKESTTREIRQAFKKLALTMHPDKNPGEYAELDARSVRAARHCFDSRCDFPVAVSQNDQSAHDKFLKINRAYEVLKDEDLRKKYDKYGEKGLDEQQGGRYESWSYYRYDFGRPPSELITLQPFV